MYFSYKKTDHYHVNIKTRFKALVCSVAVLYAKVK